MSARLALFTLAFLLSPIVASGADKAATAEQQILQDLSYFASDAMEGRDTGSEQIADAAEFLKQRVKKLGYRFPEKEPDGFQEFSIASQPEMGEDNELVVSGRVDRKFELDEAYRVCSFGGNGTFKAPVVFCGYAIDDAENGYDEFADVDLKGKVALIMRRVPRQSEPGSRYVDKEGVVDINRASLRSKMQNAKERGAVAVLFVNDPHSVEKAGDELFKFGYGGTARGEEIPVFQITVETANRLLKPTINKTLEEVEKQIDETMQPLSQPLKGIQVEGEADIDFSRTKARNVIAVLEPQNLADEEVVIIGAHYDHVGWGTYGSLAPGTKAIHNGADDNASGSIALLSLAERLAQYDGKWNRRVVLVWFSAEERGLLGSKHYVENPIYPLDETIAMINLDMVGRMADEKLTVFGVGSSSVWKPWLDEIQQKTGLNFFRERKALGPSDHAPFYQKEIPVLHLFTGLHEDYHRPTDDIDEVNIQGIRRVVDVLEMLVSNLATSDDRPDYIEIKERIQVGRHAGGLPFVGITPRLDYRQKGLLVKEIHENSPADHAGLEEDDLILQADGKRIETRQDFWKLINEHEPGDKVELKVDGRSENQTKMLTIELAKPR